MTNSLNSGMLRDMSGISELQLQMLAAAQPKPTEVNFSIDALKDWEMPENLNVIPIRKSSEVKSPPKPVEEPSEIKTSAFLTKKIDAVNVVKSGTTNQEKTTIKQLDRYYGQVNEDRVQLVLKKFMSAIKHNRALGWLTDLPYQAVHIQLVDLSQEAVQTGLQVLLSADMPSGKESWLELGDEDTEAEMTKLLASGWPKKIRIVVNIGKEVAEYDSPATVSFFLAHQIGAHFAPYWELLDKALIRNRLLPKEARYLMSFWYHSEKTRLDHRELHRGFLLGNRPKFSIRSKILNKPIFRDLIDILGRTHFKGANQQFLWEHYCSDVASFNPLSGKRLKSEKQQHRQRAFYVAYEQYVKGERRSYPWLHKINVYRGLLLGFALCTGLSVLAYQHSASIGSLLGFLYQWVY